jgi:hypothetical protein
MKSDKIEAQEMEDFQKFLPIEKKIYDENNETIQVRNKHFI